MENSLPINGRIVIVDDKENEVAPLMRTLSRNSMPYVYVKPELSFLPDKPCNDVRLLFLDLNLLGENPQNEKAIKSKLYNVLQRIISASNFPYIIVLWSVQYKDYEQVVADLFAKELSDRRPIAIYRFVKSDFFPIIGGEEVECDKDILVELNKLIANQPAYRAILTWENAVHAAADHVLDEIFENGNEWNNHANYVLSEMGRAYAEQHYSELSNEEKIKRGLFVLNLMYSDTLDDEINSATLPKEKIEGNVEEGQKVKISAHINDKLLVTNIFRENTEPGMVLQYQDNAHTFCRKCSLINNCISKMLISKHLRDEHPEVISEDELRKLGNQEFNKIKKEIENWSTKIAIIVTPSCDYAQNKTRVDRLIEGIIVPSEYKQYLLNNEAIYCSPTFMYNDIPCVIVIDYRCLVTAHIGEMQNITPLFKLRRQLLAEIQSKLSRHINRQGIMNL